jgi:hypothetical protein
MRPERSEACKQAGEVFGRGDIETVMADPITPDNVLWRSGALIPASTAPDEELGYLTHHRIFACLPEIAGYRRSHWRDSAQEESL